VRRGTRVTWVNRDAADHTVTFDHGRDLGNLDNVGARAGARLRWPRRDAAKRLGHDRARRRPGLEARVALALVTMRCGDRELPLDLPVEPTAAPASLSAAGRNEAGDEHLHLLGDVTPRAQAQRSPRRAASGAPRGGRRSLEGPAHLASGPRTP
jgi:hypothetical protein